MIMLCLRVFSVVMMNSDIVKMQKRPHSPGVEFNHAPLVVLNNFSGAEPHKQVTPLCIH
jgi:hypothetical protein